MESHHDGYTLSDQRLDFRATCALLWGTYWARNRTRDIIERSVRYSLCFALFKGDAQVGFARVVTDYATVGYLCDVVIAGEHRGRGLGKWMLAQILDHPQLRGCRLDLFTRDAQEFYHQHGFGPHPFTSMVRYPPGYGGGSAAVE